MPIKIPRSVGKVGKIRKIGLSNSGPVRDWVYPHFLIFGVIIVEMLMCVKMKVIEFKYHPVFLF